MCLSACHHAWVTHYLLKENKTHTNFQPLKHVKSAKTLDTVKSDSYNSTIFMRLVSSFFGLETKKNEKFWTVDSVCCTVGVK